jgi:hypothetical protein
VKIILIILVVISSAGVVHSQSTAITIQLKNNDVQEQQTRDQLNRLMGMYTLDKWIFTNEVIIESGLHVVPHSHPVLTLSTRHLKDDDLLLATFIHEQLHWLVNTHLAKEQAYAEIKSMYPQPQVKFPEGSGNEIGTYYHILICYLEYRALKQLLGELRAYAVLNFWKQDHYTWVYDVVLRDQQKLEELVRKHAIAP